MNDTQERTDRETLIRRLRDLAQWLEDNPSIPISPFSDVNVTYFGAASLDDARGIMAAAPGGWDKQTTKTDDWVTYRHGWGEPMGRSYVAYQVHVAKNKTCERVQVGTRHVEARDEPVYEWKCGD